MSAERYAFSGPSVAISCKVEYDAIAGGAIRDEQHRLVWFLRAFCQRRGVGVLQGLAGR